MNTFFENEPNCKMRDMNKGRQCRHAKKKITIYRKNKIKAKTCDK